MPVFVMADKLINTVMQIVGMIQLVSKAFQ